MDRCAEYPKCLQDIRECITRMSFQEEEMEKLWRKYDGVQRLFLGALILLVGNLSGVIVILLKMD